MEMFAASVRPGFTASLCLLLTVPLWLWAEGWPQPGPYEPLAALIASLLSPALAREGSWGEGNQKILLVTLGLRLR